MTKFIAHLSTGGTMPFECDPAAPDLEGVWMLGTNGSLIHVDHLIALEIVQEVDVAPASEELPITHVDEWGDTWMRGVDDLYRVRPWRAGTDIKGHTLAEVKRAWGTQGEVRA